MAETRLYTIPDELLAQYSLRPGSATTQSYSYAGDGAVLVPLRDIRGPVIGQNDRGYEHKRLCLILRAIADGEPLPLVPVYRKPGDSVAVLLDGAHRFGVSLALGYPKIPCQLVTRDEAESAYSYHEPDGK